MINKEQARAAMENLGYRSEIVSGAVMVLLSAENYRDQTIRKQIKRDFKTIGYDQSRGVKVESGQAV